MSRTLFLFLFNSVTNWKMLLDKWSPKLFIHLSFLSKKKSSIIHTSCTLKSIHVSHTKEIMDWSFYGNTSLSGVDYWLCNIIFIKLKYWVLRQEIEDQIFKIRLIPNSWTTPNHFIHIFGVERSFTQYASTFIRNQFVYLSLLKKSFVSQ